MASRRFQLSMRTLGVIALLYGALVAVTIFGSLSYAVADKAWKESPIRFAARAACFSYGSLDRSLWLADTSQSIDGE